MKCTYDRVADKTLRCSWLEPVVLHGVLRNYKVTVKLGDQGIHSVASKMPNYVGKLDLPANSGHNYEVIVSARTRTKGVPVSEIINLSKFNEI